MSLSGFKGIISLSDKNDLQIWQLVGLMDIYCEKTGFGQISRYFSLNSLAIRLEIARNLSQIGLSLITPHKSDRLLV